MTNDTDAHDRTDSAQTDQTNHPDATLDRRGFLKKTGVAVLAGLTGLSAATDDAEAASSGRIVVEGQGPGRHDYRILGNDVNFGYGTKAGPYPENPRRTADKISENQQHLSGIVWDENVDDYTYDQDGRLSVFMKIVVDGHVRVKFDPPIPMEDFSNGDRILVYGDGPGHHSYKIRTSPGDVDLGRYARHKTDEFGDPVDDDDYPSSATEELNTLDLVAGNISDRGHDSYKIKGDIRSFSMDGQVGIDVG